VNFFKHFFIIVVVFQFTLFAQEEIDFSEFIDTQINLIHEMNESNITQEKIEALVSKQEELYSSALDELMSNKNRYINDLKQYSSEIFALNKIININKRAGNTYAVLRDEVKIKSYELLRTQNIMIKNILLSLDEKNIEEYEKKLDKHIVENQLKIQELFSKDYKKYLTVDSPSKTLAQAKKNIETFYTLKEINVDTVNYLYKYETKMYRLNKYTKYHLIDVVIYINNLDIVKQVNPFLTHYGLNVIKILFIVILFLLIYFFKKIVYVTLESYILKLDFLSKYSKEILEKLRKPIELYIVIMNINMIIYVYNDFSSINFVSSFFDILYSFFLTLMVYIVVNTVASIKLNEVSTSKKKVKNELINVGIKILNFVIIIIGLLLMLHFAGVNLTAVLSGLGIGGFAVAFAARDTISNFFGTLSILFSDVFSQGDWIVVGAHEGVVVEIGLRVTTIRTFDNALIAIPNGTFANTDVKNWDKRTLGRRIKMSLGVTYSSKREDLKNAVQEIHAMLDKHPGIATTNTKYEHKSWNAPKLVSIDDHEGVKRTLLVFVDEFGASSINILIYCYSKSVVWHEWLAVKEDVMLKMMEILEQNNLEFAFPSLSLYHENSAVEG
jgi:MscS family membrane protein